MAPLTASTVFSTGTRAPTVTSSFSFRSAAVVHGFPICVPARSQRSSSAIKAMGGAPKFKGTQIREKQLTELIEKKVLEAKQVCEGDRSSDECKVAWDEVEEISQAKADLRLKLDKDQDPLESFCQENPETDECRIYDD